MMMFGAIYISVALLIGIVGAFLAGRNDDDDAAGAIVTMAIIWPLIAICLVGIGPFILAYALGRKFG